MAWVFSRTLEMVGKPRCQQDRAVPPATRVRLEPQHSPTIVRLFATQRRPIPVGCPKAVKQSGGSHQAHKTTNYSQQLGKPYEAKRIGSTPRKTMRQRRTNATSTERPWLSFAGNSAKNMPSVHEEATHPGHLPSPRPADPCAAGAGPPKQMTGQTAVPGDAPGKDSQLLSFPDLRALRQVPILRIWSHRVRLQGQDHQPKPLRDRFPWPRGSH